MFISGGPDRRIKDPFVRQVTYPIVVIILVLLFAVPMVYGLLGVFGLFVLIPGFVITYIWAIKRKGFPPR